MSLYKLGKYVLFTLALFQILQVTIPPVESQGKVKKVEKLFKSHELLRIDPKVLLKNAKNRRPVSLTTDRRGLKIELEPYDLRAANYRAADESGSFTITSSSLDQSPIGTYRGKVLSDNSEVRLTVSAELVEGVIVSSEKTFYIEPLSRYEESAGPTEYILYEESDIQNDGLCGVTLEEKVENFSGRFSAADTSPMVQEIELATEADYEYVKLMGSARAANDHILSIINQVEGIYKKDLNLSFKVVYQHTWSTEQDPYTSTEPAALIEEFIDHWKTGFSEIDKDLAHMWTGKDFDGSVVGIARVGVTCRAPGSSYGISQHVKTAIGRLAVTAHEIGHNFNATHMSDESCTDTLMTRALGSSTKPTFCNRSRAEILGFIKETPECLSSIPENVSGNINYGTPRAATSFTLKFQPGWNLFSIPVDPISTDIETLLGPLTGKFSIVFGYDASNSFYESYSASDSTNTLRKVRPAAGYWIYMDSAAELVVRGSEINSSYNLRPGWNLIGTMKPYKIPVEEAVKSMGANFAALYSYDSTKHSYQKYSLTEDNGVKYLEPGRGYWAYLEG
jgi:hypothetical protein